MYKHALFISPNGTNRAAITFYLRPLPGSCVVPRTGRETNRECLEGNLFSNSTVVVALRAFSKL